MELYPHNSAPRLPPDDAHGSGHTPSLGTSVPQSWQDKHTHTMGRAQLQPCTNKWHSRIQLKDPGSSLQQSQIPPIRGDFPLALGSFDPTPNSHTSLKREQPCVSNSCPNSNGLYINLIRDATEDGSDPRQARDQTSTDLKEMRTAREK